MDDQKSQPPKKGETHPEKIPVQKKSFWSKQLPMWLQNLSLFFGMAMTLFTGALAWMTFTTQTEIKGMKEILATFKPDVRAFPTKTTIKNDTLFTSINVTNLGTRAAKDFVSYVYFVTETDVVVVKHHYETIAINETIVVDANLTSPDMSYENIKNTHMAIKLKFTDVVTNNIDSTIRFISDVGNQETPQFFTFLTAEKQAEVSSRIKKKFSDF